MRARTVLLPVLLAAVVAVAGCAGTAPAGAPPAASHAASPSPSPASPSSPAPSSPAPSRSAAPSPAPSAPAVLTLGMSGPAVRALQQRLTALKYYPGPVDGQFGQYTLEAVWAFQEVQGLATTGEVGPAMQRALADPRDPPVLVTGGGSLRVEISLRIGVLVLYRNDQVALISHVSAGGGYYYCSPGGCGYAVTPVGDFRTTVYMPGWITVPLGEMYNSVFFIGTVYAIHGEADVPLEPVSHGCVRIPMDIAEFFHTLVTVPGTPVYIRN